MGQNLMVLAGYRGSGKTTMLSAAHSRKLPLFGEDFVDAFSRTSLPSAKREMDVPFEDAVAQGSWLSGPHLPALLNMKVKPDTVVIHWDFITLIQMANSLKGLTVDDVVSKLKDKRAMADLMKMQALILSHLVKDYERAVIRTLICPWDEICKRMKTRDYESHTLSHRIFDPLDENGYWIHTNIYRHWHALVESLPCDKRSIHWRK